MRTTVGLALGVLLLGGGSAVAELKVGDAAPGFELQGSDGNTHRLSEMGGEIVVLAWFPKAFTSG